MDLKTYGPIMCVLFGLGFLIMGVVWLYDELKLRGICVETEGTVIEWKSVSDGWGPSGYQLIFEFIDPRTGELITQINPCGGNYRVGEKVKIVFDPNNPTHAEIKSSAILWILLLWILFCVVFTVVFIYVYLRGWW